MTRGTVRRAQLVTAIAVVVVAATVAMGRIGPAFAATGDIGIAGPATTGAGSAVTSEKPESKLWWNDGSWWGSLFDTVSGDYHIFRLNTATQTWIDTGVTIDPRPNTHADVLWTGSKLYVASHVYSHSPASGFPSRLYRFSYSAATRSYALDAGFPAQINNERSETLVIDRDSTGKLWATWTQDSRVYVNRTVGDDLTWGTPFVPSLKGTTLSPDDISAVVAFGGNRIGLMYSNQVDSAMYFAEHVDGTADTSWTASRTAVQGPNTADDHINLKSLQASDGRVFAMVKTSLTSSASPLIMLLARNPSNGDWTSYPVGRVSDHHTRPILLLDGEHQVLHVFATSGENGGSIYEKTSPMSSISFATGLGTPVIRDTAHDDMNNATSTKQVVNSTTGLVVLASTDLGARYWHHWDPLGGGPSPSPTPSPTPVASATPSPPPGGGTVFTPVADAQVKSSSASTNYGTLSTLRVREDTASSPTTYRSYLRFTVSGFSGTPSSAKLRLWVTDASADGGNVFATGGSWTESGLTWSNAPAPSGSSLGSAGSTAAAGSYEEITLSAAAVSGNGTYNFVLKSGSTDSAIYSSREDAAHPPQLVLGGGGGPTPTPTATPTQTPTPTPTPSGTPSGGLLFTPVADAQVKSSSPSTNYGTLSTIRVREDPATPPITYRSYLRFAVTGLSGTPRAITLRLWVTDASADGGSVFATGGSWTEGGITWSNAPAPSGGALGGAGATGAVGRYEEISISPSAIGGNGTYNFVLKSGSTDSAIYSSREDAAHPPQLVMTP